jgi:subtilisin family serine protease
VGIRFRDGRVEHDDDFLDLIGHGTAVAATIREKAPEAELYSIRIFRRQLAAHAETLLAAMEWAVDNRLHLINLSLGCTQMTRRNAIEQACLRAEKAGVLVVSAAGIEGKPSLPGCLSAAIGVESDPDIPPSDYRSVEKEGGTVFITSPWARELPELPREKNLHGSSLAVANVTGIAARALELHRPKSVSELMEILRLGCAALP